MASLIHPDLKPLLHSFWYRFRFLGLYIVIGVMSILLETSLRSKLLSLNIPNEVATSFGVVLGIAFAAFANIRFNFRIPKHRRNRALFYFTVISLGSGLVQLIISRVVPISLDYESSRILISGSLFFIAYLFHRRFSFRDFKRVGVAVYATGVEDISSIHKRIGQYPDFIHVDVVDETFSENPHETKLYRLEAIRAFWPSKEIHCHIMSTKPSSWLDELLEYSDLIYVHWESSENVAQVIKSIQDSGVKAGVALTTKTPIEDVIDLIPSIDALLLLTIEKPGHSGQTFVPSSLNSIESLNKLPNRRNFAVCIDGGVNEKIIPLLAVEDVVSGSNVLSNKDPKNQILKLQTAGRYELS